jgi:predicted RNA-binding Zn-ribbon protein involved in translation (DUF1610 family)
MILGEKDRARAEQTRGEIGMGVDLCRGSVQLRRWVMGAKATGAFRVGIFAIACISAIFSAIGCQTTSETAVNPTNPMCPLCGRQTQAQAATTQGYAHVVCPTCGAVSTVDPDFLDRLEVFIGGPVGDTVYACAMCRTVVEQCAVCRAQGGTLTSRNIRRWQ